MLKPAQRYEGELADSFRKIWFDEKYMFYNNGCFYQDFETLENTLDGHQFVSVINGTVIGFIGYSIDRVGNIVYDFNAINFSDNKIAFSKDLVQAVDEVFTKFNFNKIEFEVLKGNPAEKMYDKFIKQCGGRIVGTYTDHVQLIDGKLYDCKMYELFKKNYMKNRDIFLCKR